MVGGGPRERGVRLAPAARPFISAGHSTLAAADTRTLLTDETTRTFDPSRFRPRAFSLIPTPRPAHPHRACPRLYTVRACVRALDESRDERPRGLLPSVRPPTALRDPGDRAVCEKPNARCMRDDDVRGGSFHFGRTRTPVGAGPTVGRQTMRGARPRRGAWPWRGASRRGVGDMGALDDSRHVRARSKQRQRRT